MRGGGETPDGVSIAKAEQGIRILMFPNSLCAFFSLVNRPFRVRTFTYFFVFTILTFDHLE